MREKRGQISTEYIVIVGFVTIIVTLILGVGVLYGNSIKNEIKESQKESFADKIVSTAEEVFYEGKPSKSTILVYLPEGIKEVSVDDQSVIIGLQTSNGLIVNAYRCNVPISLEGSINLDAGIKKLEIRAEDDQAVIKQV